MPHSHLQQVGRHARLTCITAAAFLLALAPSPVLGQEARGTWELLVCADPDNLPYSNRDEEGFENEIAEILADELDADLEYAWLPLPRRDTSEELMIRMGFCDVLLGVPDGTEPYLTTLAYYRSTAVFVLPEDAEYSVESLDDPILRDLTIGVQRGSPEDIALVERGMIENVRHYFASDPGEIILADVANGTIDMGIVWGPIAGYHQQRLDLPVTLQPATPQFSRSFLPMVQSTAMAVRAHDRALQEALNRAMAARWGEIRSVLRDYGVPLVSLPEPRSSDAESLAPFGIGLVLPSLTGVDPLQPLGPELVAQPAWQGAVLAEEQLGGGPTGPFRILQATAPTPGAAVRAARRLIEHDGASAIVGGVGEGQAQALAQVTRESEALFVNIGDSRQELRCLEGAFHVEASDSMYLSALAQQMASEGLTSHYVVHSDDERGEKLLALFAEVLPQGAALAGTEAVPADEPLFLDTFERIEESGADSVMLLLEASGQLVFLGQYDGADVEALPFGFPFSLTQTRQFYAALVRDSPRTGTGLRVGLWDSALESEADDGLNERFRSRWGRPMDPPAWSGFAAIEALYRAFEAAQSTSSDALEQQLLATDLELAKEGESRFEADSGQLLQRLYVVEVQEDAAELEEMAVPVTSLSPEELQFVRTCPE